MKIIRYQDRSGRVGLASEQPNGSALAIEGDLFGEFRVSEKKVDIAKRLAPLVPNIIWAIGLNYRHHAKEAGFPIPEYPVVFAKSPSSVQHPDDPIVIPTRLKSDEVDFECELAVVIGKTCKNASRQDAFEYVFGYTCANDVSARDWQLKKGGSQWCRGKNFDTFAPLGPCVVTKDDIPDPHSLRIQTILNGVSMQDWTTGDMIFDIGTLIEFLSASTTLLPGTLIMTGTPQGVGMGRKPPVWLKPGDEISIVIEKIGTLTNPVRLET